MATQCLKVYDAFLGRITADEWTLEEEMTIIERDWQELLKMAIFRFKYPRIDLEVSTDGTEFVNDLTNEEIQMLAIYMKHEWIKRCIASWEQLRQLYADKDFSQANHLAKLTNFEEAVALEVHKAEGIYNRSVNKNPSSLFKNLAGKRNAL